MKRVAVGLLEQWADLDEHFLRFLTKQRNFKREIKQTRGCERIKGKLEDSLTQSYLSFVVFAS